MLSQRAGNPTAKLTMSHVRAATTIVSATSGREVPRSIADKSRLPSGRPRSACRSGSAIRASRVIAVNWPPTLVIEQPDYRGLEAALRRRPARPDVRAQPVHREADRLAVEVAVDQPPVNVGAPANRRSVPQVVRDLTDDAAHRALAGGRRGGRVAGDGQPDRGEHGSVPRPEIFRADLLAEEFPQVAVHVAAVQLTPVAAVPVGDQAPARRTLAPQRADDRSHWGGASVPSRSSPGTRTSARPACSAGPRAAASSGRSCRSPPRRGPRRCGTSPRQGG